MSSRMEQHPPFSCDAGALDPDARTAHFAWIRDELPGLVQTAHELTNGLALQLSVETLPAVALFIDRERRCCPFLRFGLEVEPEGGGLWLRLTGPDGVAEFLRADLNLPTER